MLLSPTCLGSFGLIYEKNIYDCFNLKKNLNIIIGNVKITFKFKID